MKEERKKKMMKKIIYFLYQVMGVYMFFYALFSKTIFGFWSQIAKLCFFILLLICFFHRKRVKYPRNINGVSVSLFYFYLLIIGGLSLSPPFDSTNDGYVMCLQFFYFPLYIYIFLNFESITDKSYLQYFRYLINVACAFVVINIFLFFYELPIWVEYRPWFGRISNGYPTTDVVCLSYALLIVTFVEKLKIGNIKRIIYTVILIFGIISQASGTGFVLLFLVLIVFSYCQIKKKCDVLLKNLKYSMVVVIALTFSCFTILYSQEPDISNSIMSIITNKISSFIGDNNIETEWEGISFNGDTMEVREHEFENSKKRHMNNPANYMFGVGFDRIATEHNVNNSGFIFVEDQYSCNMITIGYFGSILFLFFICSPIKKWMSYRNKCDGFIYYLGLMSILFSLLSCKTTIILLSAEIELILALLYSIILRPESLLKLSDDSV